MGFPKLNIIISIFILPSCYGATVFAAAEQENVTEIDIGVIVGNEIQTALELAAEDVNRLLASSQLRLLLHFQDSNGDPIQAASAGVELLQRGIVAMIGPQTSQETGFVAQLCDHAQVPMVSFSATDPLLSSHRCPFFIRLPHSDAVQMRAIAELVKQYGWRKVVAVYADNDYGSGALSSLSESLQAVGSEIAYKSAIPTDANRVFITGELYKLMTMQPRVFVVHMTPELGKGLFSVACEIGMMADEYVWIITDGISTALDAFDASALRSMRGVLGTRSYIPRSAELDNFDSRWKQRLGTQNPGKPGKLSIYTYYAYDAVSMIGSALQKWDNRVFSFSKSPSNGTTELKDVKIFRQGDRLMHLLSQTDFRGLSGHLRVEGGEIAGARYEILNVVGESGYHKVGLWTKGDAGISEDAGNLSRLESVTWPGGSRTVPKGWATPVNRQNVLRIAVPIKRVFNQFVETTPSGKETVVSGGFVIDVFNEVVKRLPYALPYKFIPYRNIKIDDLVLKVFTKEFDAAVGDVSILANRSNYVDFTQPFSESGLVMVVPIKKADSSNAWAFLRPFTLSMWIATFAFFLFTGVVVWVLEHKRNKTFRGNLRNQVLTCIWFSFSTLFFVQRERIVSSLARGVVIVWLFVVLILTSSYTASLTSILTVKQMEPAIADVQSLIGSRAPVGYQKGSFVGRYLQEQLGIHPSQLHDYSSPEDYATALSKGPKNGGVAAIFDEIPYIRVFVSTHCGYTTIGPTYRTGGFGFVFPKGSSFVSDVSKAVLDLSESSEMQRIQNKWFNMTACTKAGAQVDSDRLSMESFWGLYLLTGTASVVALLLCIARLLYNYTRHDSTPKAASLSTHFKSFVHYFDRREPSSYSKTLRTMPPCNHNDNYGNYSPNTRAELGLPVEGSATSMRAPSTVYPPSSERSSSVSSGNSWDNINLGDDVQEANHSNNRWPTRKV
uniref:Glutamate receptor n=1 Tax=Araucaria cunninghamii TaxID=56994 RepID=A0A0D6QSG0_ARACU